MNPRIPAAAIAASIVLSLPAAAAERGRVLDPERRTRLTFTVGDATPIEGGVQETDRPLNSVRDQITPEAPESFTFDELGLDESESTFGLAFEHQWRWVTFFLNSTWLEASAQANAPRDLFIGVSEVRFDGREYDYQRIPAGAPYAGEIDLFATSFRFGVTPVTLNPGGAAQFVPWIGVGLFTLAGEFEIDAGPATGVQLYEFPPREYVIGGRSKGDVGALAPELGIGGELLFRLSARSSLVLQGNYMISDLSVSTRELGVDSRNEKEIDLDYRAADLRAHVELPMGASSNVIVGVEYRNVVIDAVSRAQERTIEEIFELQEKFNKEIDFEIESVLLHVGFRW